MKFKTMCVTFILLLALFLCSTIMAAPLNIEGISDFTVILKPSVDMSSYEFGFSKTPVTQWTTNPTPIQTGFVLDPYIDKNTGSSYATMKDTENLFLYWRIYSLNSLKLTLSQSGPLQISDNQPESEKIHWKVYWKGESNAAEGEIAPIALDPSIVQESEKLYSNGVTSAVAIEFPKYLTLQNNAGSMQLYILTDSLEGKSVSGKYQCSLVLSVEVIS